MCTSPIAIANPSKNFRVGKDKRVLHVPCGSCPECKQQKQLSWTTRLYYEWQNSLKHGGSTYYYTLTYNNEHLPKMFGIPVFSKDDIQKFFKRLRRNLERVGYNTDIKYFLTSEYGHEHHRPHYHFLLFVYQPATVTFIEQQIRRAWSAKNDPAKSIGFIAPGSLGSVVESISALNYVAKYIMKDTDFDPFYDEISSLYDFFNEPPVDGLQYDYSLQRERDLKKIKPFHMQSHHLGECILDEMHTRKRSLDASRVIIPDTQIQGQYKEVPVPLYIKRKLYYNESCPIDGKRFACRIDKKGDVHSYETYSVSYVLNDVGIRQRVKSLDDKIDERVRKYESYRNLYDTKETFTVLGMSVKQAYNEVLALLDGRSIRSLVIYDSVYRGRYDYGLNGYHEDYLRCIDKTDVNRLPDTVRLYNHRPEFENFDEILDVFNIFGRLESYTRINKNIDKWNSRQVVLTQTNPNKYRKARFVANIPLKYF